MSSPRPFRFNPSTPVGYAEMLVRGRIDRARSRIVEGPRDLGASVVEWVVITAMLVAIAVVIGGIILNALRTKANTIKLDTNLP